jgi:hypothetical protein
MTINMEDTKSFNLKDLITPDILNKYVETNLEDKNKLNEINREILRKKLRNKTNNLRLNRSSKDAKEKNQLNMLKENSLFQNIEGADNETMKKMVDAMASKMTNDSKQKKNAKKQITKLLEKI